MNGLTVLTMFSYALPFSEHYLALSDFFSKQVKYSNLEYIKI